MLECSPVGSVVRNLGSPPEMPTFELLFRKQSAKKKKKACQTKEESDNICLIKITYREKGNQSKKHSSALREEIILSETDCVSFGSESH